MARREPLPPGGISSGLIGRDDTLVTKPQWNHLAEIRAVVGQCRACQGNMQAVLSDEHDRGGEDSATSWYESQCQSCGKVVAAPNGRVLRRSGLTSEWPRGWAETREARDAEHAHGGATPDSPPRRRRRDRSY